MKFKKVYLGLAAIISYFVLTSLQVLPFSLLDINVNNIPLPIKVTYLLIFELLITSILFIIYHKQIISDFKDFDRDKILKKYQDNLNRDIILGKTTVGIHHDDIKFNLNDDDLKEYGSEGQQKNAIIALKLAEINIFKQQKESYPILILDDLFSELDKDKINNILKLIDPDIQTFITTTELDKINDKYLKACKVFNVQDDKIEEVIYEK